MIDGEATVKVLRRRDGHAASSLATPRTASSTAIARSILGKVFPVMRRI